MITENNVLRSNVDHLSQRPSSLFKKFILNFMIAFFFLYFIRFNKEIENATFSLYYPVRHYRDVDKKKPQSFIEFDFFWDIKQI